MFAAKLLSLPVSLLMSVASVGGVDIDYNGEVDIYSGSPVSSEESLQQQTVTLADGALYNKNSHTFIYTAPDSNLTVRSTAADGMITTGSVSLDIDSSLTAKLYLDGEEDEDIDLKNITKSGRYSLVVYGTDVERQLLSFTIVSKKTGAVTSYKLPLGFDLKALSIDNTAVAFTDVSRVDMSKDGKYSMTYRCNLTGIDYGLEVEIDHTPPSFTLDGVTDGSARGPVTVKDYSKDDSFRVLLNGENYKFPADGVLSLPGTYELTASDDAGNTVTEKFEIKFYLNYQGLLFGLLFLAVAAAAIGYMIWSRKRLRVR